MPQWLAASMHDGPQAPAYVDGRPVRVGAAPLSPPSSVLSAAVCASAPVDALVILLITGSVCACRRWYRCRLRRLPATARSAASLPPPCPRPLLGSGVRVSHLVLW